MFLILIYYTAQSYRCSRSLTQKLGNSCFIFFLKSAMYQSQRSLSLQWRCTAWSILKNDPLYMQLNGDQYFSKSIVHKPFLSHLYIEYDLASSMMCGSSDLNFSVIFTTMSCMRIKNTPSSSLHQPSTCDQAMRTLSFDGCMNSYLLAIFYLLEGRHQVCPRNSFG